MVALTPESLFAARMRDDPASPLVTFYDDATGERAELSAKSIANWVAKTHFLLVDELGRGPGDRAALRLPVHWLAAPILLGCWYAGLEVISDPLAAPVVFGDAPSLNQLDLTGADEVFAVSLLTMARSAEPPVGMTDYAAAVRPQPDSWPTVRAQAPATAPALDGASRTEVAERAKRTAAELGLRPGGRLMLTTQRFEAPDWITAFVTPLSVGGSVVLVRNSDAINSDAINSDAINSDAINSEVVNRDANRLSERATAERVTVIR